MKRQPARAAFIFSPDQIRSAMTNCRTGAEECRELSNRKRERFSIPIPLPRRLLIQSHRPGAAWWTPRSVAQLPNIDLKLIDRAAERIAVHAQFAGGSALVAFIFLQHGQDEAFLELPHTFRIQNVALIHLQNQGFQLIFHVGLSLFSRMF